ncbi:MAG TPA: prepilin-type N-terminal cleavage/methylation domain-containing protein [Thermoanaerobaculia bacterium]|nr:prepilin-type N-terminal cleavage/methylation domain-containing protein [Thermoanaerobaculia bacterium]
MKANRSQRGMSLVEVIVVMAIALVIIMASFQMLEETTRVTMFIETRNDLPIIAQSAVNYLQTAISQSKQIFDADTTGVGPGYLAALTVPMTPLTGSRMPLINTNGQFVADTTDPFTGNCLLIARQLAPIEIKYTGGQLELDRYRFEYYFLTKRTNWKFVGSDGYVDAMRARSNEYADYFQLSNLPGSITAAQRKEINEKLMAQAPNKILMAWDPGQPINKTMYKLTTNGTSAATAYVLDDKHKIVMNDVKSITPQINSARVFGKMNYSIAFRKSATETYPITTPVSRYAVFASAKPLFPSGLEFVVVGNATTRRVLSRLTIMAHYRANEYASQEASVITAP